MSIHSLLALVRLPTDNLVSPGKDAGTAHDKVMDRWMEDKKTIMSNNNGQRGNRQKRVSISEDDIRRQKQNQVWRLFFWSEAPLWSCMSLNHSVRGVTVILYLQHFLCTDTLTNYSIFFFYFYSIYLKCRLVFFYFENFVSLFSLRVFLDVYSFVFFSVRFFELSCFLTCHMSRPYG